MWQVASDREAGQAKGLARGRVGDTFDRAPTAWAQSIKHQACLST